ncbi:MAG: nucleotide exchange factor GrpE [Pirellulaceae bacterium]
METDRTNNWPDTEHVIARFRHWLDEAREDAVALDDEGSPDEVAAEAVGLYQFVEQLTSLRHEVKLLTKAARNVEERNEATLLSMQAGIEQFRSVQAKESQAADQAARPFVAGLTDLDEVLRRGRRAIEHARQRVLKDANTHVKEYRQRFEDLYRSQPWWRRVLCRPWHAAIRDIYGEHTLDAHRNIFDSLLEGYDLIQTRLQRTLDEQTIIRMQCVGRQVDPNSMTVIDTINDPSRPPGLVVEEVRPGYYWKTKVFRFAEVKAVGER